MKNYILRPDELAANGITTVIIATPDLQGRLVGRRIPISGFERVIERGVEICTCAWAWDIDQTSDLIDAGVFKLCSMHNGVPDVTLKPDLSTLRRAAWLDGVAICLADPVDLHTAEPMSISPRVILRQELQRYHEAGFVPQAGTELEFYLFLNEPRALRKQGFRDLEPTTSTPSDFLLHEGNNYEGFFQKLRGDLEASGIEMEAAQSEWGTGQWEMTFVYGDPLEMADRHALYKLAVRDSAAAAGMSVTFMARPLNGQPGSSCHIHFSLLDQAHNSLFWDDEGQYRMSKTMRSAIGGALEHASSFMTWYAPTINSYRRTNSRDVAGHGRTWGHENRSVTARVVGTRQSDLRFEFRLPGADTNPYLALSGLLASARDGMQRKASPPEESRGNSYDDPMDEPMPANLAEAADAFAAAPIVAELIGAENQSHFAILARYEWKLYQASVSSWDLERYFDRI